LIGTASHHQMATIAQSDSNRRVNGVRTEIGPILLLQAMTCAYSGRKTGPAFAEYA